MKSRVAGLCGIVLVSLCSVSNASAKITSKKSLKIKSTKTSNITLVNASSTCGPYTTEQLREKQNEAADLIDDCRVRFKNCAAAQSMIAKINQTVLDIDAMNFVYGSDTKNKEPKKEVIQYAIAMIKSSSCYSKKTNQQLQLSFLKNASPTYVLSAAIACQNNISYFRTTDAAYRSSAPLTEMDYSMMPEYSQYINEQHQNAHGDPWTIANTPYKITDQERSKASPISISDTSRFGYIKSSGKITPIDFEGFKNLVVSASACVYTMNNDSDRSNDDYIPPVVTDFSYTLAKR